MHSSHAEALPLGATSVGTYSGSDVDWTTSPLGANVPTGLQWKQPVVAATTADITISTALNDGDTLDGVTLATGDRVLVKDQSTASGNGIYIVGTTPARAVDMDESAEVLGAVVYVVGGTANASTMWSNTNTAAVTVDTDAITFAQFDAPLSLDDLTDVTLGTPVDGDVLTYGTATGVWSAQAASGSSPLTTKGDVYVYGSSDDRLPVGTNDYVLTADSTQSLGVKWAASASGFSDPMTTRGDIIVRASGGTDRLALGTNGQVLTSDGTDAGWATPSGGSGALVLLEQHTASRPRRRWTSRRASARRMTTT